MNICGELHCRCARRNVRYCRSILTKIGMRKQIPVKYFRIEFHANYLWQPLQVAEEHAPKVVANFKVPYREMSCHEVGPEEGSGGEPRALLVWMAEI
jgi:hypothetical protein